MADVSTITHARPALRFVFLPKQKRKDQNMKKLYTTWSAFLLLALCGCASGFSRHGYSKRDLQPISGEANRPVVIKFNAPYEKDEVAIVGQIKAYDTGISLKC